MIYVLMVLIFGVIGCVLIYFDKRKKVRNFKVIPTKQLGTKAAKAQTIDEYMNEIVAVDAYVYQDASRRAINVTIPGDTVKIIRKEFGSLGRLWNQDGSQVYAFEQEVNGHYIPVERAFSSDMANPPQKGFRATQQQKTERFFTSKDNRNLFQKYGHILLFAGVVLFIMFLVIAKKMK